MLRPTSSPEKYLAWQTMSMGVQSSGFSLWRIVGTAVQLWVGALFFILGTVFTVVGIQTASTEQAYNKTGLTVDATVLDKSIERAKQGKNSRTRYVVNYRFLSEQGHEIESVAEVPVEEWEGIEPGSRLQVTYLPEAPETNRVDGDNEWIAALVFLGIGGIFALIGGGLAFTDLRSIIRTIRVSRNGLMTEGTVLRAEPSRTTMNKVPQWCIHYRYRDHLGHEQEAVSHLLSPKEGMSWKTGDTGRVRYDEQCPSISIWMGQP